jgi:hypothetical protein
MKYSVDHILACLDQLDLEPVFIVSARDKKQIRARVAYAVSGKIKGKMKGLVILVPDRK